MLELETEDFFISRKNYEMAKTINPQKIKHHIAI